MRVFFIAGRLATLAIESIETRRTKWTAFVLRITSFFGEEGAFLNGALDGWSRARLPSERRRELFLSCAAYLLGDGA